MGNQVRISCGMLLLVGLMAVAPAAAQELLPNGQQQFVDANGAPLAGGSVYFYIPGTTNAKATYQDQAESVPNTNPVVLNAAGRATIWGTGLYREILYDRFGNLIWDQITGEATSSGPGTGAPLGGFGTQTGIASATTVDLGSIATHNAVVSGTTSITSFGSNASLAAPIYLVEFAGSLTLTENAVSMILPGGTNIQTSAGDVALLQYVGTGNWQVIEYQRASGTAIVSPVGNVVVFTAGGGFVLPAGTVPGTIFDVTVCGGGGGGGGAADSTAAGAGAGGGSGGCQEAQLDGFTAGATMTFVIGNGGAGGTNVPGNGGAGGNSSMTYNAVAVVTANGGVGGGKGGNSNFAVPGAAGTAAVAVGGSGLTLVGAEGPSGQAGGPANSTNIGGFGGSCLAGTGGAASANASFQQPGNAGTGQCAGGSGGVAPSGGSSAVGGAGAAGIAIVRWVL